MGAAGWVDLDLYVPGFQRRWRSEAPHTATISPRERETGVVLFFDVVGFTGLSKQLEERGPEGAEILAAALNHRLGPVVDRVQHFGGEVLTLVGDAVISYWPGADPDSLGEAVLAATRCSLEILDEVDGSAPIEGTKLVLRAALSVGEIHLGQVGGRADRWLPVALGQAFATIAGVDRVTAESTLCVSYSAWELIADRAEGEPVNDDVYRVREVPNLPATAPAVPRLTTQEALPLLPPAVSSRQAMERMGMADEFRLITAAFLSFDPGVELEELHDIMLVVQAVADRFEGTVDKVVADEKGVAALIVFGYPGQASTAAAARALAAGQEIATALTSVDRAPRVGIASGRSFCGAFGGRSFRQYSAVSSALNRASRIVATATDGQVLCDETTAAQAARSFEFSQGPMARVKKAEASFQCFLPHQRSDPRAARLPVGLFGRDLEVKELNELLVALSVQSQGTTRVIVGESGSGKSNLLTEFQRDVEQMGPELLVALGDPLFVNEPYHCFKSVVTELLSIGGSSDDEAIRSVTDWAIERNYGDHVGLLSLLTGLELGQSVSTGTLSAEAKSLYLNRMIARLFTDRAAERPIVLVVDDLQFVDSASVALLQLLADVPSILMVVATRPIAEPSRPIEALIQRGSIELDGLDRGAVIRLAARALDVDHIDRELADYLDSRTAGLPLHVEQLVLALRDSDLIAEVEGVARLSDRTVDLNRAPVGRSIGLAVAARVEQLPDFCQVCLKAASVIGRAVTPAGLQHLTGDEVDVVHALSILGQQHLVTRVERDSWAFEHALVQRSIYELMPFAQRRSMHGRFARWVEEQGQTANDRAAELAHHWAEAEQWPDALRYLELAGERALAGNASAEAAQLFETANSIADHHPALADINRRAQWSAAIAEAWYRQGRMDLTIEKAGAALPALGQPWAQNRIGMARKLTRDSVHQVIDKRRPTHDGPIRAADEQQLRALALNNRVTEAFIFEQDVLGCMYSAMREVDLARKLGRDPELARALAVLAIVLGVTPLRSTGDRLLRRSREIVDDPATSPLIRAYVLIRSCAFRIQGANFDSNLDELAEAQEICERMGDIRLTGEAIGVRAFTQHYSGANEAARQSYLELLAWARASYDDQYIALASASLAELSLRADDPESAEFHILESLPWVRSEAVAAEFIMTIGTLAKIKLAKGDDEAARLGAEQCLRKIAGGPPTAFWTYIGLTATCDVLLELWNRASLDGTDDKRLRSEARSAVLHMHVFSLVFGIGQPASLLARARYQQLAHGPTGGRRLLSKALRTARSNGMMWEADLASRALKSEGPAGQSR